VQEHAPPHHAVLGMLDAENVQPACIDQPGIMSVIGLVLVEDMPERIPMGSALDAQIEGIVGIANPVPVLASGNRISAGRQHLVDGIEAPAEQAGLRAVAVERDAEREHLAGTDEARGMHDVLRGDVIERADVIVLAPPAPVLELGCGLIDRLAAHLDVHCGLSPDWSTAARALFAQGEKRSRFFACRIFFRKTGAHFSGKMLYTRPRALKTTSGVIGISVIVAAPSGRSASLTAFMTHPGAPAVPASPAPL